MAMSRNQAIGLTIVGLILAFVIGFLPSWSRLQATERQMQQMEHELEMTRLQGRLGAALAESQRGNYERARQLMTHVFSGMQQNLPRVRQPERRQVMQDALEQRDEIITLLSRAQPESTQRLMILYTEFFAAMDPLGRPPPAETGS